MDIQIGKSFETTEGNTVKIIGYNDDAKTMYVGQFTNVGQYQSSLKNRVSRWRLDGKWDEYPDGVHDLVKEVRQD